MTYIPLHGGLDRHIISTELVGVMSSTETHVEYRLCTTVLDESPAALEAEEAKDGVPQYFYEHSIMKLDLINGSRLIMQMMTDVGEGRGRGKPVHDRCP